MMQHVGPGSETTHMSKKREKLGFEEAMRRLDDIVEAMEAGEIGIEESISKYEEAMQLAGHCRKILDQCEQRIKKIQVDAAGQPKIEPFEPPQTVSRNEEDAE
jgi:exodeoxyribonuclease VII small subunit